MISLDMPTVLFSYLLTDIVSTFLIVLLWWQNRNRFDGITLWVVNFVFQTIALILIILRGQISDWISIDLSSTLVIAGALLGLMGLEKFIGKKTRHIHNYVILAIYAFIHTWFTFVKPDLAARALNTSVAMVIMFSQCSWLMFSNIPKDTRRIGFVVGMVFFIYTLINIARIIDFFVAKPTQTNYFNSSIFETSVLISFQLLFILLTCSLTLMYNRRLLYDIVTQEEKFRTTIEELRESEKTHRLLIHNLQSGVVVHAPDSRIILANEQASRLLGLTVDQMMGKTAVDPAWNFVFENEVQMPVEQYPVAQVLATMAPIRDMLVGINRPDTNDRVWMLVNAFPEFDSDGNLYQVVVTFNDISKIKQAEEELRLKDIVFDGSIAANSISDANGIIIQANAAFIRTWGYSSKEEVIGKPIPYFFENEYEAATILKSLSESGKWSGEYTARRKDGSIFIAYSLSTQIRNGTGEVMGYQSSVQDITERKKTEETLVESEKKFRNLFEHSPLGKSLTGIDGSVYVNKSFCEILGYSEDELRTKNWRDISYPDDIGLNENYLKPLLDGTSDYARFEKRYIHKNGNIIYADLSTFIERDNHGVPTYYISTISDITERKQIEEKIRKMNEDLESRVSMRTAQLVAANKELEAFSYSVSHDLRAPLRAIHSFANILVEDYKEVLDDEGRRITDIIKSSSIHLGKLIDDLLEFSRTGRSGINYSMINMTHLFRSVYQELTQEKEKGRVIFLVRKLPSISGDNVLMKQVVRNLISNALKYTSKKEIAEIEIGSESNTDEINYWVKDNGVGFEMQYMNKLFGVFQRLHSKKEFDGNGVGLAIVKRIILRHEGRVWAEGEVNKGATFYFALPVKK